MGGAYRETPLKQVQYGGMCAYLIKEEDKNIEEPIARIAIKRFVGENDAFIFACENRIYGDRVFSEELDFLPTVKNIIKTSNKETSKGQGIFTRKDANSYSDNRIKQIINLDNIDWNSLSKSQIDLISKNYDIPKTKVEQYADKLNLTIFVYKLLHDLPYTNTSNETWTEKDVVNFINKYHDKIDCTYIFNNLKYYYFESEIINGNKITNVLIKYLNPSKLTKNLDELPLTYVLKHLNKFNFTKILTNCDNSSVFLSRVDKETWDKIGWDKISSVCKLFTYYLSDFYYKYAEDLNWNIITKRICKQGIPTLKNISLSPDENTEYTFENLDKVYKDNINYDILGSEYDFTGYNSRSFINFFKLFNGKFKLSSLLKNPTIPQKFKKELSNITNALEIKKDV